MVRVALKSVAISVVNSLATTCAPAAMMDLVNWSTTPWPYVVRSSITAMALPFSVPTAYLPKLLPNCAPSAMTVKAVSKPWRVYLGLVADGDICGLPASLYRVNSGIVVTEVRFPIAPATLAYTNFGSAVVPCLGSAAPSSTIRSSDTGIPPNVTPYAVQHFHSKARIVFIVFFDVGNRSAGGSGVADCANGTRRG